MPTKRVLRTRLKLARRRIRVLREELRRSNNWRVLHLLQLNEERHRADDASARADQVERILQGLLAADPAHPTHGDLSLIHISEPTRLDVI
eukprot:6464525-Prorocentrum_lima.AAC.1